LLEKIKPIFSKVRPSFFWLEKNPLKKFFSFDKVKKIDEKKESISGVNRGEF